MTDNIIDLEEALKDPDLDLLVDYISNELAPEHVAEVERRLREDEEFQIFAAPIIAAWTATPKIAMPVIPPGRMERDWDEFTRRNGFTHQRARNRRRWTLRLLGIVFVLASAGVGAVYASQWRNAQRERAEHAGYSVVPSGGRVVTLGAGASVKVPEGARIRIAPSHGGTSVDTLRILGSATVEVVSSPLDRLTSLGPQLTVKTLATVGHQDSLIAISAPTDTTPVAIYAAATSTTDSVRHGTDSLKGPVALRPSLVFVPGHPLVADDSTGTVDPASGQPKKGKHYWTKSVVYLVAMVAMEVLIR